MSDLRPPGMPEDVFERARAYAAGRDPGDEDLGSRTPACYVCGPPYRHTQLLHGSPFICARCTRAIRVEIAGSDEDRER